VGLRLTGIIQLQNPRGSPVLSRYEEANASSADDGASPYGVSPYHFTLANAVMGARQTRHGGETKPSARRNGFATKHRTGIAANRTARRKKRSMAQEGAGSSQFFYHSFFFLPPAMDSATHTPDPPLSPCRINTKSKHHTHRQRDSDRAKKCSVL